MLLRFYLPAPADAISGGHIYDRAVADGLRALGHRVHLEPLEAELPPSGAARLNDSCGDERVLIDGLCLPAFAPHIDALAARCAAALVHHPAALETGRPEAERERVRATEQTLLPRLHRVIVTSTDTAQRLAADFGVQAERIRVVQPGIPDAPRSPGPSSSDGCLVLSVGPLLPRKGHDILLRALARLPDLDWTLVIAGAVHDPGYAATLRSLGESPGIAGRVTFAGALDAEALEPLWQRAGVFALATHYEGYGIAIAEALRRGVPVAVTTGGAAAALLTPEAAVTAAPGDAVALSNGLRRLIFDAGLRAFMADAAWEQGRTLPSWQEQVLLFASALED